MTKAKFTYELIDQCMTIFCQDNILVENFELSDDDAFYEKTEEQFVSCLKFYDDMKTLFDRNEIDEATMDQELKTVLVLIRQKALERLFWDFEAFLNKAKFPKDEREMILSELKKELQTKTIDSEYLMKKLGELRKREQNS